MLLKNIIVKLQRLIDECGVSPETEIVVGNAQDHGAPWIVHDNGERVYLDADFKYPRCAACFVDAQDYPGSESDKVTDADIRCVLRPEHRYLCTNPLRGREWIRKPGFVIPDVGRGALPVDHPQQERHLKWVLCAAWLPR